MLLFPRKKIEIYEFQRFYNRIFVSFLALLFASKEHNADWFIDNRHRQIRNFCFQITKNIDQ